MAQLLIRPSLNDHEVVADLIAPPVSVLRRTRPPIGQLVVDAHIAVQRPRLAESANEAGIPLLVDPMTTLLQSDVDPKNSWAKLPFAIAGEVKVGDIDPDQLVEQVVEFQVEHGATRIIAPYLYASDLRDPAFAMSIRLLANTRHYLEAADLPLPLVAVFCGQLRSFSRRDAIDSGLRRYLSAASDHGATAIGTCLSPLGAPEDSYAKVVGLFRVAEVAMASGIDAVAWRQGIYGPALVAAGFAGYETGIGTGEQTNIARLAANRKAKENRTKRGGGGGGVFLDPLGRSVSRRVAETLLGEMAMRPKLMCDDVGCCPGGVADTLDHARQHAIRSRARQLAELNDQPHRRWRLNHVEQQARGATTLAGQANRVLVAAGIKETIKTKNLDALGQVLAELREAGEGHRSA